MKKHRALKITALVFIVLVVVSMVYLNTYYHAEGVTEYIKSGDLVDVSYDKDSNIIYTPKVKKDVGFVFYPGGKVEYTSYAPLMYKLAEKGVTCILLKVNFNLAIFEANAAKGITDRFDYINEWYIGGHSLGGTMAANYIYNNKEEYNGLVLLAAYSNKDISNTNVKTLVLYGDHDKVMNKKNYDKYRDNLPINTLEFVITGGNHGHFGCYGEQSGDGKASIDSIQQIEITVNEITNLMKI